ncbi:MAG: hypothetical protein R3321_05205 [Nitrososphaeraceae archaeon]|nr:hypothetical protein [Nitrososphaeraceae archaeon]
MALFQKSKTIKHSQLTEFWAGLGLIVGIWAVTFGVVASGILPM